MGAGEKFPLQLMFNPKIQLEFRGAAITSDAGLVAFPDWMMPRALPILLLTI